MTSKASSLLLGLITLSSSFTTQCANSGDDPPKHDVAPPAASASAAPKPLDDQALPAVRVPIDELPAFGSIRAPVTIVAFTDYECPYCSRAEATLATLRAEYGDRVRTVIASRPLPIHDKANAAARAFLAGADQGKTEAMHRRLFAKDAALDDAGLVAAARDVGLDLAAFDRFRSGDAGAKALGRAEDLAARLSVDGTPTFFVNGRRLVGARPIETFRALVDEELARARALADKGVRVENVYETLMLAAPEASALKRAAAVDVPGPDEVVDVDVAGAPTRGPSGAPATIAFFSDYECPYCVKAEAALRALEAANPDKIRVAYRYRPLPFHVHARLAAKASIAASRQNRFWPYHDVLVLHRDALEKDDLVRYATELGLNRAQFLRDLDDPGVEARVAADEKQADTLGVKGTPTSFVNGRRLTGAQPLPVWQALVDRAIAPPAKTVKAEKSGDAIINEGLRRHGTRD